MTTDQLLTLLRSGLGETLYITFVSTVFAYLLGLPLAFALVITRRDHIAPVPIIHGILDFLVNILRSVPFLILLVAVIPFTRGLIGVAIGTTATIVPLIVASFPYVARTVESSLLEVDRGVIEAAQAMGATNFQIMRKVMLREAFPGLINGAAIATTTILGYSAMSGAVGGGGLGAHAIMYGHQRREMIMLYSCVLILIVLVQIIQFIGTRVSRLADHRLK